MSLINCSECHYEISDRAQACVKCGQPLENSKQPREQGLWNSVAKARTPINIFAIAMMACASVLGASATQIADCFALTAFTYTIHAFIAVSGMFFLAILFCRKGIYHPEDLNKVKPEVLKKLGTDRPIIAAILIAVMMSAYGYYQYSTDFPCHAAIQHNAAK